MGDTGSCPHRMLVATVTVWEPKGGWLSWHPKPIGAAYAALLRHDQPPAVNWGRGGAGGSRAGPNSLAPPGLLGRSLFVSQMCQKEPLPSRYGHAQAASPQEASPGAVATMALGPPVCGSLLVTSTRHCEGLAWSRPQRPITHTPCHRRGHGWLALGSEWGSQVTGARPTELLPVLGT